MTERPLDDPEISKLALGLDEEIYQVAVWGHLLRDELVAGSIRLPISSLDELHPLFVVAEQTVMPTSRGTAQQRLRRPRDEFVPETVFPIRSLAEFVRLTYAIIVLEHRLGESERTATPR